jgi:histidyl-tRNA synthetase
MISKKKISKLIKKPMVQKKVILKDAEPKNQEKVIIPKGNLKEVRLVRGMKDIMPEDEKYWRHIYHTAESLADTAYFERIETPIMEYTPIFSRAVGENSDIVEKEMFSFTDRGGDEVSLRPEGTAGVVRAYVEHGMMNRPQPVKLWYYGPFFRYDRPQSGRQRQFHQFGCEVIGDNHPVIDAQMISMASEFFKRLSLPVTIQVNSIGDKESRVAYGRALMDFLKPHRHKLDKELLEHYKKTPLRLLDVKDEELQLILDNAPQIVDFLTPQANQHFVKVLEHLDELDVSYQLNPKIVRGLDYYSHTTFEVMPEGGDKKLNALGGGGRYDKLVELFGGREDTGACGFALGIERIITLMKEMNLSVPERKPPEVFLAQLGDKARQKAIKILHELQRGGFRVAETFSKEALKSQMEIANRLHVTFTLIIGQKEMIDDTVLIRDMENGIQEVVDSRKIVAELRKRIGGTNGEYH